jgi:NADH-quinone oxidoreductase subunit M
MPRYALVFMIFTMASVGLPGTSGFVGEFLVLAGLFQVDTVVTALAATGLVLGAAYMLWLYRKVIFGDLTKDDLKRMLDLSLREKLIFAPLIAVVFWMGIFPGAFLDVMHVSVDNLLHNYDTAIAAHEAGRPAVAEGAHP